ncbi:MAG: endonuclease III [Bacteriovoracia bacterium]
MAKARLKAKPNRKPAAKARVAKKSGAKRETPEQMRARMLVVLKELKRLYPDSKCSLIFNSPFQLLVATILSAQCTDKRVNLVVPDLFARYPDARAFAEAKLEDIEALIRTTGFYKNKALSIREMARAVRDRHGGEVPRTLDELTALRGVGRKTGNVILGNAFGIPGLVVDTHVGRISRRLGFTKELDPVKVEHALMEVVPRQDWVIFSHLLIDHGRAVCMARGPRCGACTLSQTCPQVGV